MAHRNEFPCPGGNRTKGRRRRAPNPSKLDRHVDVSRSMAMRCSGERSISEEGDEDWVEGGGEGLGGWKEESFGSEEEGLGVERVVGSGSGVDLEEEALDEGVGVKKEGGREKEVGVGREEEGAGGEAR